MGQNGDNGSPRRDQRAGLGWELAPDSPWVPLILSEERPGRFFWLSHPQVYQPGCKIKFKARLFNRKITYTQLHEPRPL